MTELRTAFLSGTSSYRGFFGDGPQRRGRIGLGVGIVGLVLCTLISRWPGVLVGLFFLGTVALLTNPSISGDLLGKMESRWWWSVRVRRGLNRYVPYSDEALAEATAVRKRKARGRAVTAVRQMPDGCTGMGWLQNGANRAGVAWHRPVSEQEYLSIAFEVDGRMRGFEARSSLNRAQQMWGEFHASLGGDFSLCRQVQTITRVLPPNAVHHEAWAKENLDPTLPARGEAAAVLLRSYEQVLDEAISIGTVQRHFVVLRYDVTADFLAQARKFGKGVVGWRALMEREIESVTRRLNHAGVGQARILTARQVAALIRHSQNPSHELDRVDNIDPNHPGIKSYDTRATYVTHDELSSELEGTPVRWYTATAAIRAENVDAEWRNMFWLNDWLTNMPEAIVRSMSFHVRVVPATIARTMARSDQTLDNAELISKAEAGSSATDEAEAKRLAATLRAEDLRPGTGHHGIEWIAFVTVTATTLDELRRHSRILAERAGTSLGIRRLEWCRDHQSTAAGYTWPIARGLVPHSTNSIGSRVSGVIGRIDQDAEGIS